MHIGVIGGGAIGLLVASYVRKAGFTVTVFTRTLAQQRKLNENGIVLKLGENDRKHYDVMASHSEINLEKIDFLFVAVKQYDLQNVLTILQKETNKNLPIAFLQNGMSHLRMLEELKADPLFVAIVEHGALRENETTVFHTGKGKIVIGALKGEVAPFLPFFQKLSEVGLNVTIGKNWFQLMQQKLIANVCINPLTAIYKVCNGQLIENPYFLKRMKAIFNETIQVLNLQDQKDTLWNYVTTICQKTSTNRSSMLRDIEQNKETEIDAICGYLLNEAKKKNDKLALIPFLYDSIKGLELEGRSFND